MKSDSGREHVRRMRRNYVRRWGQSPPGAPQMGRLVQTAFFILFNYKILSRFVAFYFVMNKKT